MRLFACAVLCAVCVSVSPAETHGSLPANAKIYVDAASGFDTYLDMAIRKRHVPLTITTQKGMADYELQALSAARPIPGSEWLMQWIHGYGEAKIRVIDLRTGDTVFWSGLNRNAALHDWNAAANACAGRLKEAVHRAESRIQTVHPILDF